MARPMEQQPAPAAHDVNIMQQQQQRQREEYGPAYSGGGGIAGIYGPGGRVR